MKQLARPLDFIHESLTPASESGGLPVEIEEALITLTRLGDERAGWPEYPEKGTDEEIQAYSQAEERYFGGTRAYYKGEHAEKSILVHIRRPEIKTLIYRTTSNMVYAEVKTPAQLGEACLLFALRALIEKEPQFCTAYLHFLRSVASGQAAGEVAALRRTAGEILLAQIIALTTHGDKIDDLIWFYDLHLQDINFLPEILDTSLKTLDLAFFSVLAEFENYLGSDN